MFCKNSLTRFVEKKTLYCNYSISSRNFHIALSSYSKPHPQKVKIGGQDSYFFCHQTNSFGVADGVGGFDELGINSGIFSRALLKNTYFDIKKKTTNKDKFELLECVEKSFVVLEKDGVQGGSTIVIGQLRDGVLSLLNLGDSGVMVMRPSISHSRLWARTIYQSSFQTFDSNCPYQLSSSDWKTTPKALADQIDVIVKPGDIIFCASDGVFDNIFDIQIEAEFSLALEQLYTNNSYTKINTNTLNQITERLGKKTFEASQKQKMFCKLCLNQATKAPSCDLHPHQLDTKETVKGDKPDDIAIVCGVIVENNQGTEFCSNF